MRRNGRNLLAGLGVILAFVTLGTGCVKMPNTAPVDVALAAGDSLTVRKTVFGIGGKLAELFGVNQEATTVVIPEIWPDVTAGYGNGTFVLLPVSVYAELVESGTTHISLGLFDETVSSAMSWVDRLNALAATVGVSTGTDASGEDVPLVTKTADDTIDWIRIDGSLRAVRTIEASNRFASYVILANPETPVILSLTLSPAARAEFDVLSSFEGFEVAEVRTTK